MSNDKLNINPYTIHNGDCLEIMRGMADNSINLILIDPPYNISKATWDKWKTVADYVEFMGEVFKECERVLKPNGSFYFFHNDFLQIVELQNWLNKNSGFIFRQLLVWNKRFDGGRLKGYLDGHCAVNGIRNYKQMCEYCLYYTFQDGSGLEKIKSDVNNFKPLRNYFESIQKELGVTKKTIIDKVGQSADHCFRWGSAQWDLPTEETYNKLIEVFEIDKLECFQTHEGLKKGYDGLRREYEALRQEYESLRYTFNNQKLHHSVMNYDVAPKQGHITPKPVDLLEYLINTSSNAGDVVLDCFMGSGSTGVACVNTGRKFIGIELDEKYFNISKERLEKAVSSNERP